jgi:hypothetical protein
LIAIGAGLNVLVGMVAVVTRPGVLGWPYVALWAVATFLALWQWRRTVREFRTESHR